jgi:hypothetical protein
VLPPTDEYAMEMEWKTEEGFQRDEGEVTEIGVFDPL